MRVTIIGGTRFIGRTAAQRLVSLGHEVTAAHRGHTPASIDGVEHITLDQISPDAAAILIRTRPDVVLHNIVREPGHVSWLESVIEQVRVPLVMTSSMDVYQSFGCLLGTEDAPPPGSSMGEDAPLRVNRFPYRGIAAHGPDEPMWHYDKIPAEELARELGEKYSVPVVIPRLPMVLGAGDPQRRLSRFVHSMKPGMDGRVRERIVMTRAAANWRSSYGFVENVAAVLAGSCVRAVNEEGFGTVLHAVDGVWSLKQLAELVASELNWEGKIHEIDDEGAPETLGMPGASNADLNFTQPRTDELMGEYRVVDSESGFKAAIAWELEQEPQGDLDEIHTAEDGVQAGT